MFENDLAFCFNLAKFKYTGREFVDHFTRFDSFSLLFLKYH